MTGRLVHTGQVVVDLVMRVSQLPQPGGDVLASSKTLSPGGGFNVMSAAARSGARVVYAGSHGTGVFGDLVRAALADEGIEVAHPVHVQDDTGIVVVLVDDDGERTFVTGTGAEGALDVDLLAAVAVDETDLVYVSGYSLLHPSNRAALLAWLPERSGARVLFDPGPLLTDIPSEVLSTVDLLSCNASEARLLTGEADIPTAITALAKRLPAGSIVLVRDGASGCLVHHGGTTVEVPAFPVQPVDTNGAGDTHCGVVAAELLRGTALDVAALRANAAAALSVTRHGPATAPTRPEIDELTLSEMTRFS
jgi:sugar/nucleoside kinase (ribokinase family)